MNPAIPPVSTPPVAVTEVTLEGPVVSTDTGSKIVIGPYGVPFLFASRNMSLCTIYTYLGRESDVKTVHWFAVPMNTTFTDGADRALLLS